MNESFLKELEKKVSPYFEGSDPCHDFFHTKRVFDLAVYIGKREGADLDVLMASSILHDVARREEDESKGAVCHAKRGAQIAFEILKDMGFPVSKLSNVLHCIESHRFRNGVAPESIEAKVLYDADKLDSIGAIGIARAYSFAGKIGAVIYDPFVEDYSKTLEYSKDDSGYREFVVKLRKVKDNMMTNTGRKIAIERHNFMELFFDRLSKEAKGFL